MEILRTPANLLKGGGTKVLLEKGVPPIFPFLKVAARVCCSSYMACNQIEKREMRVSTVKYIAYI